jgi:transcriptional regulator with XRE-family HTH domain
MNAINFRILDFLKKEGITQEMAAKELGVTQPYMSSILSGNKNIGVNFAKKLSQHYKLSMSWILTGEGELVVLLIIVLSVLLN